jgi:hypothetical protein
MTGRAVRVTDNQTISIMHKSVDDSVCTYLHLKVPVSSLLSAAKSLPAPRARSFPCPFDWRKPFSKFARTVRRAELRVYSVKRSSTVEKCWEGIAANIGSGENGKRETRHSFISTSVIVIITEVIEGCVCLFAYVCMTIVD